MPERETARARNQAQRNQAHDRWPAVSVDGPSSKSGANGGGSRTGHEYRKQAQDCPDDASAQLQLTVRLECNASIEDNASRPAGFTDRPYFCLTTTTSTANRPLFREGLHSVSSQSDFSTGRLCRCRFPSRRIRRRVGRPTTPLCRPRCTSRPSGAPRRRRFGKADNACAPKTGRSICSRQIPAMQVSRKTGCAKCVCFGTSLDDTTSPENPFPRERPGRILG